MSVSRQCMQRFQQARERAWPKMSYLASAALSPMREGPPLRWFGRMRKWSNCARRIVLAALPVARQMVDTNPPIATANPASPKGGDSAGGADSAGRRSRWQSRLRRQNAADAVCHPHGSHNAAGAQTSVEYRPAASTGEDIKILASAVIRICACDPASNATLARCASVQKKIAPRQQ